MAPNWPIPPAMAESRRTATRVTPGAICLSSSSHFALMPYSNSMKAGGVAARPRQAIDEAGADRIGDVHEHDRHGAGRLQQRGHARRASGQDDVRRERDQFRRVFANAVGIVAAPSGRRSARCGRRSSPIAASPCRNAASGPGLPHRPRPGHEHADAPHPLALLRARRERPRRRRAAEQRDEFAPPHVRPPAQRTGIVAAQASAMGAQLGQVVGRCPLRVCAVERRRFPVGASPTRQPLQPEATGAVMEVTKWLKPSDSGSRIGDSASVQAATRVNAEQSSKRTMRRPTRQPFRGRLIRLGE